MSSQATSAARAGVVPPTWQQGWSSPTTSSRVPGAAPATGLAQSELQVVEDFVGRFPVSGRDVLEVGGALPPEIATRIRARQWVCVDPLVAEVSQGAYRRICGQAHAIDAPSESFDLVFSCNAFHHILDLGASLDEAHRLLRRGGAVYAHFGPIWSAPDGHHLELMHDGRTYTFWEHPLIPPWYHLACTPEELRELLESALAPELVDRIVQHVYVSELLNRLFFEDYFGLFSRSGFAVEQSAAGETIDYPLVHPRYCGPVQEEIGREGIAARIQRRHGADKSNLRCRDLLVVLRKE